MTTPKTHTPGRTTTAGATDELLVVDHLGDTRRPPGPRGHQLHRPVR